MDRFVYIDESGTPDLNDECYVISAVNTTSEILHGDLGVVNEIEQTNFSGSDIKSSGVGKNLTRRIIICKKLAKLNCKLDVLVIKKNRFEKDGGFRYRKSMYKYCQRRLFGKIYKNIESVNVILDSFGKKAFRDSFIKYIDNHFEATLFSQKSVSFASPSEEKMLGVADFVAGTYKRFFENKDSCEAVDILKPIINSLEIWPRQIEDLAIVPADEITQVLIRNHCANSAEEFLISSDNKLLNEIVQYLLYTQPLYGENFICGDKIIDHLKDEQLISEDKDKNHLSILIAKLRDEGVIIAGSRDGYKIPESEKDLEEFIEFVANKTLSYLKRVMSIRNSIYLGTGLKHDMLESNKELYNLMRPLNNMENE